MHKAAHPIINGKKAVRGLECGSALVIALVILLLMTLIGITAMQSTLMQERMAGNTRDRSLAFEAAEAALRQGEAQAMVLAESAYSGSGGLYDVELAPAPAWDDDASWSGSSSIEYTDAWPDVASPPRYRLEKLAPIGSGSLEVPPLLEPGFVRVTARGSGGSDTAVVILETQIRP